jgi:putative peptidoglycan lipid II flippase
MILSQEIITILFQRGQFNAQATLVTAGILPFFMFGAFAFSAQNIVSRGFYATQNTMFPAVFTTICVVLTLPLIFWLMKTMGVRGVALGLSLSVIIQAVILFECWSKKSSNLEKKGVYLFLLKIISLSLIIGFFLFVTKYGLKNLFDQLTFSGSISISSIIGVEFLFLFFLAGAVFKIPEILMLYENIFKKLLPRLKK